MNEEPIMPDYPRTPIYRDPLFYAAVVFGAFFWALVIIAGGSGLVR